MTLIGHSWGAWLSVLFACHHPEYVKKLILISCPPFTEKYVSKITQNRLKKLNEQQKKQYLQVIKQKVLTDYEIELLKSLVLLSDNYNPDIKELTKARFVAIKDYEKIWPQAQTLRTSGTLEKLLSRIRCPVIIIHGTSDPHPLTGVIEPLASNNVNFKYYLLENCGHYPFFELEAQDRFYCLSKTFNY